MPVPTIAPTPIAIKWCQLNGCLRRCAPSSATLASMVLRRVMARMLVSPVSLVTLADHGAPALRSLAHNRGTSMYAFLAGVCCDALILILPAASPSLAKKPSADAQFKALYTKEWKWRDD